MDTNSRATSMSYEDFSPSFDWVEGEGFKLLVVNLPGFKKEQIKVQIENNGKLRIRGEGPINASSRRSRFSELFEMPEGCKVADIRAKFENETLQVRFPVKQLDVPVCAAAEPAPKPAATLPQPESSQKRVNGQPTESVDEIKEQKKTESVKSQAKEDKSGKPAEKMEQKKKAADEEVHKANDEATGSIDARSKLQEKLQTKEEVAAKVDDEVANRVKETQKTASAMLAPGNGGGEFMARYGAGLLTGLKKEKVLLVNLAVASLVSLALGLYLKYKN